MQLMNERKVIPKETKTIGVIVYNIEDFRNWRREKKHRPYTHQDTERKYVYRNKRYICLTQRIDICGYSFDAIIETPRAYKNPEYGEILEHTKSALKRGGIWLGVKK
jgi:hypothetical protein